MNKKYQTTNDVCFSEIAFLAVIIILSLFALSPFLRQTLAQEQSLTTNATDLITNQSDVGLLDSVLNITRSAKDEARSTAAEYVLNATPSNNSMNMTNVTIVIDNGTSQ